MVEVVGTAPTSVMVITKFVYRRSWQANIITIKAFEVYSIKIMKLNKKQQAQLNQTKKFLLLNLKISYVGQYQFHNIVL
jgi:hypothetical protein